MDSGDLTYDQCRQLHERITECWKYLRDLCARMAKRDFPFDDAIRQKVQSAFDSLDTLRIALHYLSCDIERGRRLQERRRAMRGFRIQVAFSEVPPCPVDQMQWVEAPTPLEAIAKLARAGALKAPDTCGFFIRIALPENAAPDRIIEFRLPREVVIPHRPSNQ